MVRNSLSLFDNFNQLTPYAVGFDRIFDRLSDYASHQTQSTSFPPYNIRKDGDYNFEIEIALAGFGKKDIEVEVADGVLTIRSVKDNDDSDDVIHRGISYRKFIRKFTIADDIVVNCPSNIVTAGLVTNFISTLSDLRFSSSPAFL